MKKRIDGSDQSVRPLQLETTQEARDTTPAAKTKKAGAAQLQSLDGKDADFAPRLLEAARAKDVETVKKLTVAWLEAQNDFEVMGKGLLALSNFLVKFGSGKEDPKLYQDILALKPPVDRPFDEGSLELKGEQFRQLGEALMAMAGGPLPEQPDLDVLRRSLLVAANMGLNTDALKVKMTAWNLETPELKDATVSFEMGIRKMPDDHDTNFWVVGGVNASLEWLQNLRTSPEAVEWMKNHELFKNYPKEFFDYFKPEMNAKGQRVGPSPFEQDLKRVKIEALPEGEVYIGGPLMRVSGPPAVVEFIETNMMRLMTSWTSVATAAAQMTIASGGKPVADFSPRRSPGGDLESMAISAAAGLGGMTVTSNLIGGMVMKLPITGTMEHSIMMMLKDIVKTKMHGKWSADQMEMARDALSTTVRAGEPKISASDLKARIDSQLEDVLVEAHIFENYAFKFDRQKAVALVDTTHPNVGVAAAIVAQKQLWAADGKETTLNALRLDSGDLLSQGLQFRRVLNEMGMESTKIIATDGLSPANLRLFEAIEKELKKAKDGQLPESFANAIKGAQNPEKATEMAKALLASGGLKEGQSIFAMYGAGQRIGDSVETVGNPEFIYKVAQLNYETEDGTKRTVDLAKTASPSKATGPEREMFAVHDESGRIKEWVVGTPEEAERMSGSAQRLLRTVFEDGKIKVNTSHQKAVEYAAARRKLLPEAILKGERVPLHMTDDYREHWRQIVAEANDAPTVQQFVDYWQKNFPPSSI
jgi:putative nicotinate phosphoribosyltransferase